VDLGFGPCEGFGVPVVGFDEGIDVFLELLDRGEGGTVQGLSFKDREPDLDLIEPRGAGWREVEVHVWMTPEPAIIPGLVGIQIVEDDMEVGIWVGGDNVVHEIEEFDPPPLLVRGGDLPGGHLEGGEQRRGTFVLL
jgi:hypothetical protein